MKKILCALTVLACTAAAAQSAPPMEPPREDVRKTVTAAGEVVGQRESSVFGAQLFSAGSVRSGKGTFNPEYVISVGDVLSVRIWGAVTSEAKYTVDPQGNVFIPNLGPVRVQGVSNAKLNAVFEQAARTVFKSNVFVYASLEAAQPVKVFVTGGVNKPGLYDGLSSDSVLAFLQSAGGVDLERGSFVDIQVKRGDAVRQSVNLYHFLTSGRLPLIQFTDGDVILVSRRGPQVLVEGDVSNAAKFEFSGDAMAAKHFIDMAQPKSGATHFSIRRMSAGVELVEQFPMEAAAQQAVRSGDQIWVNTQAMKKSIGVSVSFGDGTSRVVSANVGQTLADILANLPKENMDFSSVQVMRKSVAQRQAQMLRTTLDKLESMAYTTRSATNEESMIRTKEAELISKFVEKAKQVKPLGQVVIAEGVSARDVALEDGDVIVVPQKTSLVLVQGEVQFPAAMVFQKGRQAKAYIEDAGGFTPSADEDNILVMRRSGVVVKNSRFYSLSAGDEIFVMPKVDSKNTETVRAITQIIYQIAVSAKVVLGL